jgi:hypothetical protein
VNARASVLVLLSMAAAACDPAAEPSSDRVGAPLAVAPTASRDGGVREGGSDDEGAASRRESHHRPLAASLPSADGGQRAQPAKALAAAREGDEAAARGELGLAEKAYERAARLAPESPWMRAAHAWFLARVGEASEARAELERALDSADRSDPWLLAAIHHDLGTLREAQRDTARAQESFRAALRAWSAPHLARALLRVTPADDLQHREALRRAFGTLEVPATIADAFGRRGATRPEPLAFVVAGDLTAVVTARPPPASAGMPGGAQYGVRLLAPTAVADAGAPSGEVEVALVEAPAIRWHTARIEAVSLRRAETGLLVTLERTAPGAGAPAEVGTTLLGLGADGRPFVLFTRVTAATRDDPIGCRVGYEEVVEVHDEDGDGVVDGVRTTRRDFTRPRLDRVALACEVAERRRPPRYQPFLDAAPGGSGPREPAATVDAGPDAAGTPFGLSGPDAERAPRP